MPSNANDRMGKRALPAIKSTSVGGGGGGGWGRGQLVLAPKVNLRKEIKLKVEILHNGFYHI